MRRTAALTVTVIVVLASTAFCEKTKEVMGEVLTNDDVIKLTRAGINEELILLKIRSSSCKFDMSTDEMVRLKVGRLKEEKEPPEGSTGVSDKVMQAIWQRWSSSASSGKMEVDLWVQSFMTSQEDWDRAVRWFKQKGSGVVPDLIRHLITNENQQIRSGCAAALMEIGDKRALSPLVSALDDRSAPVRATAAKAVADLGTDETAAKLLVKLGKKAAVLDGYILALSHRREKVAVPPILKVLRGTAPSDDRAAAAYGLGLIGDKKAGDALMQAVANDKVAIVRIAATKALVHIAPVLDPELKAKKKPTTVTAVLKAVDRYPDSRADLAVQLRHWRDKRTVAALIELLRDTDKNVQNAAYESVKLLTGEAFGLDYDRWNSWWDLKKIQGDLRF